MVTKTCCIESTVVMRDLATIRCDTALQLLMGGKGSHSAILLVLLHFCFSLLFTSIMITAVQMHFTTLTLNGNRQKELTGWTLPAAGWPWQQQGPAPTVRQRLNRAESHRTSPECRRRGCSGQS